VRIRALGVALTALLGVAAIASVAGASVESEIAFHRGVIAFGEARYADAREEFQKVLQEDPQDGAAIHYLGLISQAEGDPGEAVGHYQQALALEPDNTDVRLDLGIALLEAGRLEESRAALQEVLVAEPDRAQAHLFLGIAAYRAGDYKEAVPSLDRAVELDPELKHQARYYSGLSQAFQGNLPAAAGAFSDVEQSPIEPLARSAGNLRQQLEAPKARPWDLGLTAGMEYDSNPLVAGHGLNQPDDYRGVFRVLGSYRFYETEHFDFTGGYDGYFSLHGHRSSVDLQTHVGWGSLGYSLDPVRFSVRTDYAYTLIDRNDPFRSLVRVTPAITWRQESWGVTQGFYQFENREFLRATSTGALNRDGISNFVGVNQFFFPADTLPPAFQSITFLRVGALGEFFQSDGSEFDYTGWEISTGGGFSLPFEVAFNWLYRYTGRGYNGTSIFHPGRSREDSINRLTLEAVRPIGDHWEVSLGSSFRWQASNVGIYDFNRYVTGGYVTYRF